MAELEQIIRQPKPHLDSLTVRKFLCAHLRAMIEVEAELLDSPVAECQRELLNSKPMDMEKLSVEEQWLLELMKEEAEKANELESTASNRLNHQQGTRLHAGFFIAKLLGALNWASSEPAGLPAGLLFGRGARHAEAYITANCAHWDRHSLPYPCRAIRSLWNIPPAPS